MHKRNIYGSPTKAINHVYNPPKLTSKNGIGEGIFFEDFAKIKQDIRC